MLPPIREERGEEEGGGAKLADRSRQAGGTEEKRGAEGNRLVKANNTLGMKTFNAKGFFSFCACRLGSKCITGSQ